MSEKERDTNRVAELNDLARTAMGVASGVVITQGVSALSQQDRSAILERVVEFDDFGPDNDPYGERDFGAFEHKGNKIFWKVDCYNLTLDGGSSDPADPSMTSRILTIMLASEY